MIFHRGHPSDARGVILCTDEINTTPGVDFRVVSAVRVFWRRVQHTDPWLLDGMLALALAVGAGLQYLSEQPDDPKRLLPLMFTCLPLAVRRRYPIGAHFTQVAAAVLTQRQPVALSLVAIFISTYSAGVYSRWRLPFLAWLVVGAACLGYLFPESAPSMPAWALQLVAGVGLWLLGNSVRERNLREQMLEERALRLERERIARELHDVVAHSVSVMVVQAGAARTLLSKQPERSAEALLAVESTGRDALRELRHMLGLLTDIDVQPSLTPQPGLEQLQPLIERIGQAGLPVDLEVQGTPRPLPAGLDLTAYRIVQEALTNALKYASGAPTHVRVAYRDVELRLEVIDAGGSRVDGTDGAGRGLLGMQERVAMYGGDLEVGAQPEGGFAVRARLPLQAA
jgi:signal transduction histidine kinase